MHRLFLMLPPKHQKKIDIRFHTSEGNPVTPFQVLSDEHRSSWTLPTVES
jgi:hypothetical protein